MIDARMYHVIGYRSSLDLRIGMVGGQLMVFTPKQEIER